MSIGLLCIIGAALIFVATLIEVLWGSDKELPYNSGCLAIILGMRFSKKWLAAIYHICMILAGLLSVVIVAWWFIGMDLSFWGYVLAAIPIILAALIPLIAIILLHIVLIIAVLLVSWIKYCL